MGPTNEINVILLVEILHDYLSECITNTSIIFTPVNDILFRISWVTPKKITEKTTVWHVSWSEDLVDLLKVIELWWEATMNAEYFVVNDCGNWEAVEALDKLLPELETVSSLALIVESIDTVDRATFMIAS